MNTNEIRYDQLTGDVFGTDGDKLGGIGTLYTDDRTGNPSWVTVKTGLFGTRESFVPLHDATFEGNDIRVPYTKDQVKDAPNLDVDQHLSVDEERTLYAHYNRDYSAGYDYDERDGLLDGDRDRDVVVDRDRDLERDGVRGVEGDSVVRREEELRVSTDVDRAETGRARLRKYTVTEHEQVSVPVTREEVRVVREPVREGEHVGEIREGDETAEVVLHEERPVVTTETVAKERVGLEKTAVREQETVEADLKKERVETDVDGVNRGFDADRLDGDIDLDRDGK